MSNNNKNIPNFVSGQIYVITCLVNNKQYVGQTMTHRYNSGRKKWYNRGYMFRFQEHVKEAYSEKSTQCWALNNAIKKYGEKNFKCELIHKCTVDEMDAYETKFIQQYNTFEDGYNLNKGGWGGALHDSVYDRISQTNHDKTDVDRDNYLKSLNKKITKINFSDKTIGFHCVIVDVYCGTEYVRWSFSNRDNNIFESFIRAYFLVYDYVQDDIIEISLGLIHYLVKYDGFNDLFSDFIPQVQQKTETNALNTSKLQTRLDRYKNLEIQHITLKLRKKCGNDVICVCIRTPAKNRELVSQFGGNGVSHQHALNMAEEFAHKLTSIERITMRPDLQAFIGVHNLTLKTNLQITRKPRNVFNQH